MEPYRITADEKELLRAAIALMIEVRADMQTVLAMQASIMARFNGETPEKLMERVEEQRYQIVGELLIRLSEHYPGIETSSLRDIRKMLGLDSSQTG